MNAFEYNKMIERIGQPIDKDEWGMHPQTINAYYNPTMNEIVFPAAILQPPFFNPDADDAINYGGIGGVIGHEFSHGFDDQGCKFDGDGNLKNWWTEEDNANFKERTNKLVNQFDAYEVAEGNHVNGQLTLGENIADIAGITLAYYALEKAMEGKEDPMIDGYSYKQRFFLGWAQVWHSNSKDEALINQVKTDPHSPTRFRTIGPLVNMTEFREAFGCEEGAMIAPDSLRVTIW
jgi:predicted metalloendopeptidase